MLLLVFAKRIPIQLGFSKEQWLLTLSVIDE
jgi:hypothetical protein